MFNLELNSRLVIAVIGVSLSFSFTGDPSRGLRIKDLPQVTKSSHKGGLSTEDQLTKFFEFSTQNTVELLYTLAYIFGLVCGWPVSEYFGRQRGIIYSNVFRYIAIFLHFSSSIYGTDCFTSIETPTSSIELLKPFNGTFNSTSFLKSPQSTTIDLIPISILTKILNQFYSGLTLFLGIIYVYEIAPKKESPKVGSMSVLALYMFLKSAVDYVVSMPLKMNDLWTDNISNVSMMGIVSLIAGLCQIFILLKYCTEPPSYLMLKRRHVEKAKTALTILRETEEVNDELNQIDLNQHQRKALKRSQFLMILHLLFYFNNCVVLYLGFLHGLQIGMSEATLENIYLIFISLSYLFPLFYLKNPSLFDLKSVLFWYYLFLAVFYFLNSLVAALIMEINKPLTVSCQIMAGSVFIVSMITTIAFTSGPGLIFIVLVNEYPSQAARSKNLVISWVLGIVVMSKLIEILAIIFIKTLLLISVLVAWPWMIVLFLARFVWNLEMESFGNQGGYSDGNKNFEENRNPPPVPKEEGESVTVPQIVNN